MITSVQGIYRKGKIKLNQTPENVRDETPVIVTFLAPGDMDLRQRGISKAQAKTLRAQLATFADDWASPEMSVYDNYDASKSRT